MIAEIDLSTFFSKIENRFPGVIYYRTLFSCLAKEKRQLSNSPFFLKSVTRGLQISAFNQIRVFILLRMMSLFLIRTKSCSWDEKFLYNLLIISYTHLLTNHREWTGSKLAFKDKKNRQKKNSKWFEMIKVMKVMNAVWSKTLIVFVQKSITNPKLLASLTSFFFSFLLNSKYFKLFDLFIVFHRLLIRNR